MSIYYLAENFGSAIILILVSSTLDRYPIGLIYTMSGFVFSVALLVVLNYMQTRIGLKPEQYTKKDRLNLDD